MPCDGDLNGRSGRNVLRPAATSQVFGAQDEPGKEGNVAISSIEVVLSAFKEGAPPKS